MKKVLAFLIKAVVLVCALTGLICLGLALFLPPYLEKSLLPALQQRSPVPLTGIEVRGLGPWGADLAALTVGADPEDAALKIDSIRLDYSPSGLWKHHIDTLVVSGCRLRLNLDEDGLSLPGLDLDNLLKETPATSPPEKARQDLPVSLGCLSLENGLLIVKRQGRKFHLPFDMEVRPEPHTSLSRIQRFSASLTMMVRDNEMLVECDSDLAENTASCRLTASGLDLGSFADFFQDLPDLHLAGQVAIDGEAALQLQPLAISQGRGSLKMQRLNLELGEMQLTQRSGSEESILELVGSGRQWQVDLTGLEAVRPLPLSIDGLQTSLNFIAGRVNGQGSLEVQVPSDAFADLDLHLEQAIKGKTAFSFDHHPRQGSELSFSATAPLAMVREQLALEVPSLKAQGRATISAGKKVQVQGEVSLADGMFRQEEQGLELNGIHGVLPFVWPLDAPSTTGSLMVDQLIWKGRDLGGLALDITQKDVGLDVLGRHQNLLIPALHLELAGDLHFQPLAASLSAIAPPFSLAEVDLTALDPAAPALFLDGLLGGKAQFDFEQGRLSSSAEITLQNGEVEMWSPELFMEGMDLTLKIVDFAPVRSAPALLTFNSLAGSGRQLENGRIDFQVESNESVLVTRSIFQWCGGRLYTNAFLVRSGKSDYEVSFAADGLKISEVLEQFGMEQVEGEGTVNGRIPIRYTEGRLSFDNGFLYSTPGEGGVLKVKGSDILLAGVPAGAPQYGQIDFASEALKDFHYEWVRFNLNSEAEEVVLRMQLNGKPGAPLPFAVDRELGVLSRVEATGSAGIMQPIRLDVNLRLPLDAFLEYSQSIGDMMELF